uniref:SMP-LTD domain-containing protein n=1 Tax=Ciona savignyi TaxID=51511 RepID=H2ZAC5_CIOSA
MNETFFYDPTYYHVSNTQAAFITLDGSNLRIQTPQKGIAKRSTYKEGNIPISNVVHQRLFDITFAKIYLKPDGLVKKRVWSKKYPVVVEIPKLVQEAKTKSQIDTNVSFQFSNFLLKSCSTDSDKDSGEPQEKVDVNKSDIEILYLFGRTDRQKEEWFYRFIEINCLQFLQRCINRKKIGIQNYSIFFIDATILLHTYITHTIPPTISVNLFILLFAETFLSSSLCLGESINSDPLRAYKDYYLHISRLMPDDFRMYSLNNVFVWPKTFNTEAGFQEPGLEVAWINVLLGRITFDFLRQPAWAKWLSVKIQKKLDKIKLPYFMDELKLTELNLGGTVPLVHQISLPKLDAQGLWLEMEVTYSGSAHMTLKTKLVLTKLGKNESAVKEDKHGYVFNKMSAITDSDAEDSAESSDDDDEPNLMKGKLGDPAPTSPQLAHSGAPAQSKKWVRIVDSIAKSKYFQRATETEFIRKKLETVSNTPMMLSVELLELRGVLAVNIPPPPTDRIWYGFRDPPNMVVKAHPQVGERLVKTSHVTDWIEHKLQQEFMKVLVMPNMDDIPIPVMFHNRPPSS